MIKTTYFCLGVFLILIFNSNTYPGDLTPLSNNNSIIEEFKLINYQSSDFNFQNPNSIVTVLDHTGYHARYIAPQTLYRFERCYYLVLASEINAAGFPSGANITSLGFNYKYGTNLSTKGFFKVYFQNTSDIVNNKSNNWNLAVQQMTLVHSDTLTIPVHDAIVDIPLTSSSNFTYTGGGIYIAFEYSNPNGPLATVSNVSWSDKSFSNFLLKYSQADDSMRVIAYSPSLFRPETRLGCNNIDVVKIGPVYSMGVMGILPNPDSNFIRVVVNHQRNFLDTMIVTTKVKKINDGLIKHIFTDTIINDIKGSIIITNNYLSDNEPGNDSIIVNAVTPGEEIVLNNKISYLNKTTVNSWNHYIPSIPPNGGVGLSVGTGDYVARFHTTDTLTLCAFDLSFINETGYGWNPYKIVLFKANGPAGLPGTLLHTSPQRYTPEAFSGVRTMSTYFPSSPIKIDPGYYYAGYSQTDQRNLRVSYQIETPIRTGEFYYRTPHITGSWLEFEWISPYRFDIAPRTYLPLNIKLYLEGFYDGDKMVPDTVKIIVRSQISPYAGRDSAKAVLDSSGNGMFNFINLNSDSCYYFEIRHRNHIRTFSHNSCERLNGAPAFFDLSSSITNAYGNNLIYIQGQFSAGGFAIYGGDVNQDGIVDLSDGSFVDNDSYNFVTGYVTTDLNGDNFVDLSDYTFADNNAYNFVSVIEP
ncbi:MAG: hypothetical protein M3R36_18855 [Bacteroidota bacterium]|nr:hypothetical protein [Bacteroidota bacterium]